jgi:hypothetical protein
MPSTPHQCPSALAPAARLRANETAPEPMGPETTVTEPRRSEPLALISAMEFANGRVLEDAATTGLAISSNLVGMGGRAWPLVSEKANICSMLTSGCSARQWRSRWHTERGYFPLFTPSPHD